MEGEPNPAPAGAAAETHDPAIELARALIGDLPCVRCRYNLRGLSVRGVCPECGVPVRATVLATVDPYAGVLQPVRSPRATALGLLLWSGAALGAALATWVVRLVGGAPAAGLPALDTTPLVMSGLVLIALSGLGAHALVRPHARPALLSGIGAILALVAYILLAVMYWRIHGRYDLVFSTPYFSGEGPPPAQRSWMRLEVLALLGLIAAGLRPNYRLLVARSVLLRSGRVERQATPALVAALALAALGDGLHLLAPRLGTAWMGDATLLGSALITVGSMLFTIGLVGLLLDCIRLARVILEPAPSYRQVLGERRRRARSTEE